MSANAKPRWIVASRDPLPLGHAKFAVLKTFGSWPTDEEIEVVQDAPAIVDAKLYVFDREAVETMPEQSAIFDSGSWLRV